MLPNEFPRAKQVYNRYKSCIFSTTEYRLFEIRFHNHRSSSPLHWMIKGKLGQGNNLKKRIHVQIFHRDIQDKNQ